jgi:hypothetical protein
MKTRLILATVVLSIIAAVPGRSASPLSMLLGKSDVTISNMTNGGTVILLSCSRSSRKGVLITHRVVNALRDDDHDGIVHFSSQTPIELRSVWIAIDTESGTVATAAPAEFPLNTVAVRSDQLRKDAEGELASFEAERSHLTMLLVRPKGGAWIIDGTEGARGDRDGTSNGRLELSFADAHVVDGKENAPKHLKNGDIIAAVDLGRFDLFITEVGK